MKWGSLTSLAGIAAITILGAAYLTFGVVRAEPFAHYAKASMVLTNSAGLDVGSPILLSGIPVGKVTALRNTGTGVEVDFQVGSQHRVPTDSNVSIEQLSGLGEPYVEFKPNSAAGPYLRDGQQLDTQSVRMPLSIAEVARMVTKTMNQLDPVTVSSLAGTLGQAFNGTDASVPTLSRAGDLVAATIMSRSPRIAELLNAFQAAAGDIDWAGPATAAGSGAFLRFTKALNDLTGAVAQMANSPGTPEKYLTGEGLAPLLQQLTERLRELDPTLKQLAPALQPLVDSVTSTAPQLDLSSLIAQALNSVGTDGAVHVRVNAK